MKRRVLLKIVLLFLCFFVTTSVNAETCSNKELNSLKEKAINIKVTYDLYDSTYNENHLYYFNVLITNFDKDFYIVDSDGQEFKYMENLEDNGVRVLRSVKEGTKYDFTLYTSNETRCPDNKIITKSITLPYYNDYSQREECNGIEEFSLCQKYYGGVIDSEDYFKTQVEKYRKSLVDNSNKKNDKSIVSIILAFITNNLLIVIPSIIVIIVIVILVVIKTIKKKKRVKIKI